jgi:hypothetical protein
MFALALEFGDFCLIFLIVLFFAGGGAAAARVRRSPRDERKLAALKRQLERVEQKLDLMMARAGIEFVERRPPLSPEVEQALREGLVSKATELYMQATGKSKPEARAYIENVYESYEF